MQVLDARHMPEFGPHRVAGQADASWRALRALENAGFLTIDPIRPQIGQAEYEASPRVRLVIDREDDLRGLAGIPRRGPGPLQLWREALARTFGATSAYVERLAPFRIGAIEGRSLDEIAGQIRRLCEERLSAGTPLRTVSARYFWGDSKYLDGRLDLIAAGLGLDACPFPEMRIQLGIHIGSGVFQDVVIVENQDTFDLVCQVTKSLASAPIVVCAHGFKASAGRIRTRAGCLPLYSDQSSNVQTVRKRFESWLFRDGQGDPSVWFWGDLDWEGMRILRSLREEFPQIQAWPVGYMPMLRALQAGHGHAPAEARKEGQRPIDLTGCEYADSELIPALQSTGRFIDQEIVLDVELREQLGTASREA